MTHRGAPVSTEYGNGYILEIYKSGLQTLTCEVCGNRSSDAEDVEMRCCPRCGPVNEDAALANDLIRGLWL